MHPTLIPSTAELEKSYLINWKDLENRQPHSTSLVYVDDIIIVAASPDHGRTDVVVSSSLDHGIMTVDIDSQRTSSHCCCFSGSWKDGCCHFIFSGSWKDKCFCLPRYIFLLFCVLLNWTIWFFVLSKVIGWLNHPQTITIFVPNDPDFSDHGICASPTMDCVSTHGDKQLWRSNELQRYHQHIMIMYWTCKGIVRTKREPLKWADKQFF